MSSGLDTTGGAYDLKIYDGSAWRSQAGEFVNVTGDTMTGALGVVAGSASAPGVFFSGDTNTGLLSPGADSVALTTGGTQRIVVDSSGNVGINRSAPDNQLSIGSNASLHTDSNSFYLGSNFTSTGSNFIGTGRHAQRLFFNNASSNGYLSYSNTGTAGTAGNPITWQERIRITSDGKLGVGTA